jgi:integrase
MKFRNISSSDDLIKEDPRILQSNIIEWLIHLKEVKKLSSASITLYCAAIHHFHNMNDIVGLNWNKISSFIGERVKTVKDRPYSRQEILKLLDAASDKRLRIALLLMCSSGLRVGSIPALRIRNFSRIPKYGIYQVTVYENSKDEYITFTTVELASIIDSYLLYRTRNGERLLPNSPLLREEFDSKDALRASKPRPISTNTLRTRIFKLTLISGLRQRETSSRYKRHEIMQCHGLRKAFYSTAIVSGMNPMYVSMLAGHKIGLQGIYFKPSATDLLEGNDKMPGYASIINSLTISDENRLRLEVEKLSTITRDNEYIIKGKLDETYREIQVLRKRESDNADVIATLSDKVSELSEKIASFKIRI